METVKPKNLNNQYTNGSNIIIININDYRSTDMFNAIPSACRNCMNHPSNGGSGICLCTLGTPKVTC